MSDLELGNIPKELFDKVSSALNYNVKAMGKDVILQSVRQSNHYLHEIYFNLSVNGEITEYYYNLMRAIELDENESPDEFHLIYYDSSSIVNYMNNFLTMTDSFLVLLGNQYDELIDLFKTIIGLEIKTIKPKTLDDMIDSMYYDGDNYFLRAIVGDDNYNNKVMIVADPMLNIENKTFFFKFRYFIGNEQYGTFEEMKAGFINKHMTPPEGESQEYFWELNKKESK